MSSENRPPLVKKTKKTQEGLVLCHFREVSPEGHSPSLSCRSSRKRGHSV